MAMLAWVRKIPGLTRPFDNIGIWWAVLGPGGVLSVIMGWAASAFTPIAQYGWGAVVFAGVGAACVMMFAASAVLAAWRYFNPLSPKQITDLPPQGPEAPEWRPALDAILKQVAILAGELEGVREQVKANAAMSAKLKDLQRSAWLLTTFARDEFFRKRVREALTAWNNHPRTGPFETDDQIDAETKRVEEFIDDMRANFGESHWGAELYRIIKHAEHEGSWQIKTMTPPEGLNPFHYRDFHIACTVYDRIGAFLERIVSDFKSFERQEYQLIRDQIDLHK